MTIDTCTYTFTPDCPASLIDDHLLHSRVVTTALSANGPRTVTIGKVVGVHEGRVTAELCRGFSELHDVTLGDGVLVAGDAL